MKILTVYNQRGGAGKTTTALLTAYGLIEQGKTVAVIDLDTQGNTTYCIQKNQNQSKGNIKDLLTGRASLTDVLQEVTPQLYLIASDTGFLDADKHNIKPDALKTAIKGLSKKVDIVVIDTAPALNSLTVNALTACNYIIIPTQLDSFSLQGIKRVYQTLEDIRLLGFKTGSIAGILITRYNGRRLLSFKLVKALENYAHSINTRVFKSRIRECSAVPESQLQDGNLLAYNRKATATADYRGFITELLKVIENNTQEKEKK